MEILSHVGGCRGEENGQTPPRQSGNWSDFWELAPTGTCSPVFLFLGALFSHCVSFSLLLLLSLSLSKRRRPVFFLFNQVLPLRSQPVKTPTWTKWGQSEDVNQQPSPLLLPPPSSLLPVPCSLAASHPRAARSLAGLLSLWLTGLAAPVLIWSGGAAPLWGPGGPAGTFQPLLIWMGPRTLTPELINTSVQHTMSHFLSLHQKQGLFFFSLLS